MLTLHYKIFIQKLGSLKYCSCFIYENHHGVVKHEVDDRSKNLSISAFRLNYLFFESDILSIRIGKTISETNELKSLSKIIN